MRYIFILSFFLLAGSNVVAKKVIQFHFMQSKELDLLKQNRSTYCMYGNSFFYCAGITDSDKYKIYISNLANFAKDSIELSFPADMDMPKYNADNIAINEKYIAITVFDSVYLFDRKSNRAFRKINSYHNDNIIFTGRETLFLYKVYNNHPKDDSINTKLIIFDIAGNKEKKYLRPDFNYIGYSHLVHNFIDMKGSVIAFAQTMPYKITLFDRDLNVRDSIVGGMLDNNAADINKIDSLHALGYDKIGIKELLYGLRQMDSVIRIEKICFLDSQTLLVVKTVPGGKWEKRTLDVWQLRNKKWAKVVGDQLYETEKSYDYLITPESLPLDVTFSTMLMSAGNCVYNLETRIGPQMNQAKAKYQQFMDDYYTSKPLKMFLWQYSWEIK